MTSSSPTPSPNSPTDHPTDEHGERLRRYERPVEAASDPAAIAIDEIVRYRDLDAAIDASTLTPGGQMLLRGLLRIGRSAIFAGGGAGIEYGSLLKTAARPDHLAPHIQEASAYLHAKNVDLLVIPGMSGYPVGSMYSAVSGIPAVLLKKQKYQHDEDVGRFPAGSFVIPSYTGDGDVVMSADLNALQDIVDCVLERQLAAQLAYDSISLTVRVAGADDIIDKATMSQAVSESALIIGRVAISRFVKRYQARTGDTRPVVDDVQVVGWVTPLIKGYNRPHEHLQRWFGISPHAGLNVTSVHLDPPALGIEGIGIVAFAENP